MSLQWQVRLQPESTRLAGRVLTEAEENWLAGPPPTREHESLEKREAEERDGGTSSTWKGGSLSMQEGGTSSAAQGSSRTSEAAQEGGKSSVQDG